MAVCIFLFSAPAIAREPTRPIARALSVRGSGQCPEQDRLADEIRRWLERDELDATIRIAVEPRADGIDVELLQNDVVSGRRSFPRSSSDCTTLTSAIGLAIALAIDATFPPAPKAARPPIEVPAQSHTRRVEAEPSTVGVRRTLSVGLNVDVGVVVGVLPRVTGAFSAGGALGLGTRFEVRASAWTTGPTTSRVEDGFLESQLTAGRAQLCHATAISQVRLLGCAGPSVGVWSAEGAGYSRDRAPTLAWAALMARFETQLGLSRRIALALAVDGSWTLVQPSFAVEQGGRRSVVKEAPRFGIGFHIGPRFTF